ncbi:hypothetical protein F0578_11090 [Vibrio parahaemolyticus]|nr:hypothetical protein F0578_11090 [Vibrio parahaemolyticus]
MLLHVCCFLFIPHSDVLKANRHCIESVRPFLNWLKV